MRRFLENFTDRGWSPTVFRWSETPYRLEPFLVWDWYVGKIFSCRREGYQFLQPPK